jgi:hypothetical protein
MADEKDREQAEAEEDLAEEAERIAELFEEFKEVAPKPYADYVPDMPWER